jgi:arsenite-transporting ATPase
MSDLTSFRQQIESLAERRLILIGGKGGVGKTTVSILTALVLSAKKPLTLFTSDPSSNLLPLLGVCPGTVPGQVGDRPGTDPGQARDRHVPVPMRVEVLDAERLYRDFLGVNLENILELTDRGTLLDKDEARRFFELALPGVDELMAWLRIGELARERPDELLVVDTAPTGHTLRMLHSSDHFREFISALQSMQQKHKDLIEQFARRRVHDSLDDFLERFEETARSTHALLTSNDTAAFIPVTLSEPWVVVQTSRLIAELRSEQIPIPFVVLNRAADDCDCTSCLEKAERERGMETLEQLPVVALPEACAPLDSLPALTRFLEGSEPPPPSGEAPLAQSEPLTIADGVRMLFFAGKGGVGKTTSASSVAIARALNEPEKEFVIISVDPAHTLRDVFVSVSAPANLRVEIIDTRERWSRFRASLGAEITKALDSLTPRGMTLSSDNEVMQRLIEIAPPGADELFAIMRLADLAADDAIACTFVDTAPTGHFLRLLDLPKSAGEWVREFMRLLLRYRELIPPGSLGEELLEASRALRSFGELLHSDKAASIVVTRPEAPVIEETGRLSDELQTRGMKVSNTIVNYVTPVSDCHCDQSRRSHELAALASFSKITLIERRPTPPTTLDDLRTLVPLMHTPANG